MPLAELSEDPKPTPSGKDATPPVDSAAKMRKQVFLQFGAIIALGLALAGWYVAYRVVTARAAQPLEPGMAIVVHTPAQPQPIPTRPITTPLAVESKPAEIPATSPPVVKPVAVAPVQAGPSVAAAPEIAKPVKAQTPAKQNDAPAQPSHAKPAGIAAVETGPSVAAPEIAKPVKVQTPVKQSDAPARPSHAKPAAVAAVEAGPSVAVPEVAKPVKAPVQPFRRHEASPRTGEKYLQIAAFGPRALDGYLKTLEGQGLHPLVAPGPVDNIYRILVGPFASPEALEETRRLIQTSGIEPILRSY
jgi:hypothetical protein